MKLKDFFKLNWPIFIVFLVFNVLANYRNFLFHGMGVDAFGLLEIFNFFSQFNCPGSGPGVEFCKMLWDPLLGLLITVLNLVWQFFLANVVVMVYKKIRK